MDNVIIATVPISYFTSRKIVKGEEEGEHFFRTQMLIVICGVVYFIVTQDSTGAVETMVALQLGILLCVAICALTKICNGKISVT